MSQPNDSLNTMRAETITALNDHFAGGRLPIDEYERRVDYASSANNPGELASLFNDLPTPHPAFMTSQPQAGPPTMAMPGGFPPPHSGAFPAGPSGPIHPQAAPHGIDPRSGLPYSDKSKIVAGVLQLVTPLGIGRFYMGDTGIGIAQLLTCGGCGIWSLIDGIMILVNGGTDSQGRQLHD